MNNADFEEYAETQWENYANCILQLGIYLRSSDSGAKVEVKTIISGILRHSMKWKEHRIPGLAAFSVAWRDFPDVCVNDHAVPLDEVCGLFVEQLCKVDTDLLSIKKITEYLEKYIHIVKIKPDEDSLLTSKGLRSKMPNGWSLTNPTDIFARYTGLIPLH